MSILFLDPVCPRPYGAKSLSRPGLGGTETTVVRVAAGLAGSAAVSIAQHNRVKSVCEDGVDYLRFADLGKATRYSSVVILRAPEALEWARRRFPRAELFFWIHNPLPEEESFTRPIFSIRPTVISNSRWHARSTRTVLQRLRRKPLPPVIHIYNPIDDRLQPDGTRFDNNRLLFCSSPHKGFDLVLLHFQAAQREIPELRLRVTNPGYLPIERSLVRSLPNVTVLGSLSHAQVVDEMRSALCVFYPNFRVPETFGIIFAEANAVGTPVLAHRFGAAPEVLDENQVLDARSVTETIERLQRWRDGARPVVRGREPFRLASVVQRWKETLRL